MIYRTSILLLAAVLATAGCNPKKPSVEVKPEDKFRAPDSLEEIGITAANHVEVWVFTLSQVQTKDDAIKASKRLDLIADQFDLLLERAADLPKLSEEEFKVLDRKVDAAIGKFSGGLDIERRRIFLLPDEIKSNILPAHENLIKKFRATSRAIKANSKK